MEAHAARDEPRVAGRGEQADRLVGRGAELGAQMGHAALVADLQAEVRVAGRSVAGELRQLTGIVEREVVEPDRVGVGYVARILDGVGEDEVLAGIGAGVDRREDLAARSHVESGSAALQDLEYAAVGIGLHGVVELDCRQVVVQHAEVLLDLAAAHHVQRCAVLVRQLGDAVVGQFEGVHDSSRWREFDAGRSRVKSRRPARLCAIPRRRRRPRWRRRTSRPDSRRTIRR